MQGKLRSKLQEGLPDSQQVPTHTSAMASTSPDQRKRLKEAQIRHLPKSPHACQETLPRGFTYAKGAKAILPAAPKALKTAVGTKLATEGFFASKLNINNATEMIAKIIEDTAVKSGKYIISTARIIGVAKSVITCADYPQEPHAYRQNKNIEKVYLILA